jgi:hypothetical protein
MSKSVMAVQIHDLRIVETATRPGPAMDRPTKHSIVKSFLLPFLLHLHTTIYQNEIQFASSGAFGTCQPAQCALHRMQQFSRLMLQVLRRDHSSRCPRQSLRARLQY